MNTSDNLLQQILRNYGDDVQAMPEWIAEYYLASVVDLGHAEGQS